jgi:hypothetical protein
MSRTTTRRARHIERELDELRTKILRETLLRSMVR